jgi:hypothetical protein
MTEKKQKEAAEQMAEHDERVRMESEASILLKAKSLTNGHAGDPKLTGDVLFWLTEEMIEQGRLLRTIVLSLSMFQKTEHCALNHSGKMGKIALFGTTFKVPLSVAIGGFILLKLMPQLDHMITMLCIK